MNNWLWSSGSQETWVPLLVRTLSVIRAAWWRYLWFDGENSCHYWGVIVTQSGQERGGDELNVQSRGASRLLGGGQEESQEKLITVVHAYTHTHTCTYAPTQHPHTHTYTHNHLPTHTHTHTHWYNMKYMILINSGKTYKLPTPQWTYCNTTDKQIRHTFAWLLTLLAICLTAAALMVGLWWYTLRARVLPTSDITCGECGNMCVHSSF